MVNFDRKVWLWPSVNCGCQLWVSWICGVLAFIAILGRGIPSARWSWPTWRWRASSTGLDTADPVNGLRLYRKSFLEINVVNSTSWGRRPNEDVVLYHSEGRFRQMKLGIKPLNRGHNPRGWWTLRERRGMRTKSNIPAVRRSTSSGSFLGRKR